MWHAPVSRACDLHCGHFTLTNTFTNTPITCNFSQCIICLHHHEIALPWQKIAILVGHTFSIFYSSEIASLIYKNRICDKLTRGTHTTGLISFCMFKVSLRSFVGFLTFDPHCFKPMFKRLWHTTSAKRINKLSLFRTVPVCLNEWLMLFVCKAPIELHQSYSCIGRSVCRVPTFITIC